MTLAANTELRGVRTLARPGQQARTRANAALAYALLALVALSPLPLGSNRPFFWAASALILGIIGLCYGVALWCNRQGFRLGALRLWPLGVPFLVVCGFMGMQALPLGAVFGPFAFATADGEAVFSDSLSLTPGLSALTLLQTASYGLFFFLVAQVTVNRERAQVFLSALFGIVAIYAVFGLLMLSHLGDTLLGMQKWAYQGSATGPFVNRNSFATFLAMGLVLGLALLFRPSMGDGGKPRFLVGRNLLVLLGLMLIGAALLATQSRMGLFASVAGGVAVLFCAGLKARLKLLGWVGLLLAAALMGVAVAVLYGSGVLERVGSIEGSADVRGELYRQVMAMIAARPLTGYGAGSFEFAYPLWHQLPVDPDLVWSKAHSTYLTLWSELGIVIGSLPLLIVAMIAARALVTFLREPKHWTPALAALGVIIAAAIHSLVDFSLEIQANIYFFFAVLGVATASSAPARTKRR